jgi:hypothetical protein
VIGEGSNFAIIPGPYVPDSPQVREVSIFLAGRWLTCDDDHAFVPQFAYSLERTIIWLLSTDRIDPPHPEGTPEQVHRMLLASNDGLPERYRFMDWGPTTDNVIAFIFRDADRIRITCSFWRATHHRPDELGQVFHAELSERELLLILVKAASDLRAVQYA